MTKPIINLMIDSGAFSAYTMQKSISLPDYITFIKNNIQHIKHIINLDKIAPGNPEVAAAEGMKNFFTMKDAGLEAIPVYHARENLSWLEQMANNCNYVGLSQTSLVSPLEGHLFYDICYQYLCDSEGRPLINTHLFGDTSPKALLGYPAYSADSSTWMIQAGRAARVKLQGRAIQLRSTKIRDTSYICESDTGPKRESWEEEIRLLGLNPERVMNAKTTASEMAMIRSYLVLSDLLNLQEKSKRCRKFRKPVSLLNMKREGIGKEREGPCRIYAVLSPSAFYFNLPLVCLLGVTNVLCSYWYIANAPAKFFPERLTPFLYDPIGFCRTHDKLKRYMDKMEEVLLVPFDESKSPFNDHKNLPVNEAIAVVGQ